MTDILSLAQAAVGKPAEESGLVTRNGDSVRVFEVTDDAIYGRAHTAIGQWYLNGRFIGELRGLDLIPAPPPARYTAAPDRAGKIWEVYDSQHPRLQASWPGIMVLQVSPNHPNPKQAALDHAAALNEGRYEDKAAKREAGGGGGAL